MKKSICLLLTLLLTVSMVSSCQSNNPTDSTTNKVSDQPAASDDKPNQATNKNSLSANGIELIDQCQTTVMKNQASKVGDLNVQQIEASFDAEAFPEGTQIMISLADSSHFDAPKDAGFELGSTGYDFTLEGVTDVRPESKVKVTFKLDDSMLQSLEDEGFFQVAYFFENKWYLHDVDSLDMTNGSATLYLYHFSWLFPVKLSKEELREQTAQAMAEKAFNDANNLDIIQNDGKSDLEKLISQATGVTDTKALEAIAEYMLNEDDFTSLLLSDNKGDYTSYSTKMAEMVAKKMNSAAKIGSSATLIAGAFQAAGYAWELDAQGAAESIANALMDSSPYGKFLKLSIKVTDETIKSWKKNGIEEMYQAYKNGADDGWFGYHVDKENFEDVLDQSAAIERQISIDAISSYCKIYDKKEEDLSPSDLQTIKDDAIKALKQKFEKRLEKEADIAASQEYFKNLLDAFEDNGVDSSLTIKIPLLNDMTYEQRLESYERVTKTLLAMVGDKKIEFDGLVDDSEIPAHVITTALKKWYEEDGENKVKDYLREAGYLPTIPIQSLAGSWSGSMTFTKITIDDDILDALMAELPEDSEDGCDTVSLGEIVKEYRSMEGTSQETSATITVLGDTSLSMVMNDEASTFTYNPAAATLTLAQGATIANGFSSTLSFRVINETTLSGSGNIVSQAIEEEGYAVDEGFVSFSFTIVLGKDN